MRRQNLSHSIGFMVTGGILVCTAGCAHGGPQNRELDRLVKSERAFCRLARETTIKQAFLEYLSDDAVMLLPRPVNGKQAYAARPASPAGLSWEPSFANISAAGDLGYTFGPWEYRKHRDQDTADAYGHFVSVWQLQPDGQWKVVFDSGISHGPPSETTVRLKLGSARGGGNSVRLGPQEQLEAADRLLTIDRYLSDSSLDSATHQRLLSAMDDAATLFCGSRYPVSGKTAAGKILREETATYRWQPERAVVSASGDLGYVYGIANSCIQGKPAGELNYLRIWGRRPDGTWSIVVQKTEPIEK